MLEDRGNLEPGGAAVTGRFFRIVAERREPIHAPSPQSFREAARSEPTFRALLRTLAKYAPMVSTAGAVPVKKEWVSKRPKATPPKKAPAHASERIHIGAWPASWQRLYTGLEQARIKPSSLARYRASIHRCAQIVNAGQATADLTFLNAYHIAEALRESRRKGGAGQELRPATVVNYIDGLVALGRHGGADPDALAGVRFLRDDLLHKAEQGDKAKFARLKEIMEKGGFLYIAEEVGRLREKAAELPDHAAEKVRSLQAAALCAVSMNKPPRTGDVSCWRIGREIVREVDGTWRLGWLQEKNEHETEAGDLWPEVCEILDELILGGRPDRFIHLRYRELEGLNWMTFTDDPPTRKWPSGMIKDTLGIPSHDLRTLSADYMRLHDPETAANVIATHLGHKSGHAQKDYRCISDGDAAARSWAQMRRQISKG
jgi:hypothetical protein